MRRIISGLVLCLVVASCRQNHTYPERTFTWTGDVPAGGTVKVRNIDGTITVVPSTTGHLTVDAVILNASPSDLQVKQGQDGNDVTFCTRLGAQSQDSCGSGAHYQHSTSISPFSLFRRHRSTTVRYTLHVPPGVKVDLETVLGRIAAQNVGANVKATTVNGDVVVSTTVGTVNAQTVNGSIIASMASLPDSGDVHLGTVNGSITSVLPLGIGGMLDLKNTNGTITANYPHPTADSAEPHHLSVRLAPGSRHVKIETVNGSVTVSPYVKTTS